MTAERMILAALDQAEDKTLSIFQLGQKTGMAVSQIAPILKAMEADHRVSSRYEDGATAGRKMYSISRKA